MKKLHHIHKFNLQVFSPLTIGSGAELSPYADFFLRNGKAYYVNQQRIERKLEKEPHLIDVYVREIRRGMDNNRSDFDLYDFLEEELNIDTSTFASAKVFGYSFEDDNSQQKNEVKQIIREAEKPYIPGSSLKGAIRTAMLYDWLVNTPQGQKELHSLCDNVLKFSKLKAYSEWASYRKDGIDKKHPDWKKYLGLNKELEEDLKSLKRVVFNEAKLFGNIKDNPNLFSRDFIVRDSAPFENTAIGIYAAARIRRFDPTLSNQDNEIPLAAEAILPNTQTSFEVLVNTRQTFQGSHLSYLAENSSIILLEQLAHFTKAVVVHEIKECRRSKTKTFDNEIKQLQEFYEQLDEKMSQGEYFLRIGASKTFFDNVLVLALFNFKGINEEQLREVYLHYGTIFGLQSPYPITRTVTKIGHLPFGWVKIEKI